ncbi:MAG TPA: hypothetical protein VLV29_06885 [Steroidobacteraceae bacterium]|nr:hypothetical protein [Steroidobacteraceae bacterium]
MNKLLVSALLLVPAAALAASAFDGTWKMRVGSIQVTGKPDVWVIAEGTYSCASCDPPVDRLPADGAFHKVSGHAYYDELQVRVLDARTAEITQRQNGKTVVVGTMQVSADGKSLSNKFTSFQGAQPVTGTFTEKRVAAGPPGSHALSGSWLQDQMTDASDALRTVSIVMSAEGFAMQSNGQSYSAKFDGKPYPVSGDPGNTQVVLKKINGRTVEEVDYRQGKVVDEIQIVAAADGKTVMMSDKDVAHGQTTTMIFDKQ